MNKQKDILMIAAAAVVLVALNVGVFMASSKGAIVPIDNTMLWGAFVALNVASILWAISLLGLQPLVVSISYLAGGFLAFQGVRGMGGVSVAEITTAGATYGAFGALAIGNMTAKVRLAFFNKGQVPFIFIIVGLLVVDALLNSQVSHAGGSVLLNAVVLPFVIAGVVIELIWSVLNRYGIGRKPAEVLAERDAYVAESGGHKTVAVEEEKVIFQMPSHVAVREEEETRTEPAPVKKVEIPQPIAPAAQRKPEPVEAVKEAPVEVKKEEDFFPLEIDKGETLERYEQCEEEAEEELFELPTFDESLYASGSLDDVFESNILVKEPKASVKIDAEPAKPIVEKAPIAATVRPQPKIESVPKAEITPKVEPAPKVESAPKKEAKSDDWLGGHLDLLNKLK